MKPGLPLVLVMLHVAGCKIYLTNLKGKQKLSLGRTCSHFNGDQLFAGVKTVGAKHIDQNIGLQNVSKGSDYQDTSTTEPPPQKKIVPGSCIVGNFKFVCH